MTRSEFRYNKKRRHYSYLFKDVGNYRKNILLTSKQFRVHHKKIKINIRLYKHPSGKNNKEVYVIPLIYIDDIRSFDSKVLIWNWDKNDKRKIKRIKKHKKV